MLTLANMSKVGLDAEIAQRMRDKYDPELEQKALDWIGVIIQDTAPSVIGRDGDALFGWLKDGVRLCKLINCIVPETIPKNKITLNPRHALEERVSENMKKKHKSQNQNNKLTQRNKRKT